MFKSAFNLDAMTESGRQSRNVSIRNLLNLSLRYYCHNFPRDWVSSQFFRQCFHFHLSMFKKKTFKQPLQCVEIVVITDLKTFDKEFEGPCITRMKHSVFQCWPNFITGHYELLSITITRGIIRSYFVE